jgi:peptide/nickel transport system substrate-binding protein
MDNRFTFKDFVFAVLFVVVIGAMVWSAYQYSYQEQRLNDVKSQLQQLDQTQKQQLTVLAEIRNQLRSGVSLSTGTGTAGKSERIRRKNPDGSQYVYFPDIPTSPRHPEARPDYATGDWLIQNIAMEPEKLTPLISQDMGASIVQTPVLESLIGLNPETLEYEPTVADWYEISADGLRFKFHIRAQACFSDGEPMTADDVVFSFNTVMNKDVDAAPLRSYYEKVKGCRKIDGQTVEFEMKEPYFLAMEFVGGLTIIPEHVYKFDKGDDYNRRGDLLVGSGPYRVEKWARGEKITMTRNDKYWGDRPTYDKIVYLFIGNPQSQLQSFLNGQLDYMGEPIPPDPEQYIQYSKDPDFIKKYIAYKFSRPVGMYMYLGYNMDKPMFKDKETRQALTMLINRKEIIDKMLLGFGSEMTGPFTPRVKQNDPSIQPIAYDPDAAKKKLAAAGWKPGPDGVLVRDGVRFEFNLSLRTGVPIRERMATYVQQQFQQAGIRVRLTPSESAVLLDNLKKRNFDACIAGWGAGGVESDPKQIFHSESALDQGSNHVGYRNPEADRLIDEARRTVDADKRMELWHKFQQIIYDDQPYTWLYSEQDCAFINGRFKNTEPYPLGLAELDWYVPLANQKYR